MNLRATVITAASDFAERTVEGARAGIRAVAPALSGRDLPTLAFLAAGETAAWARLFGWKRINIAATAVPLWPAKASPVLRAGVLAGAAGQVAKVLGGPTPLGVACVGAQHAAFAWELRHACNDALGWGLRAAAWAAGIIAARTPAERGAAAVAGAAVAATSALAGDPQLRAEETMGASHGANLLLFSEALTVVARGGILESLTHTAGTVLLVDALTRR
ncbi:hypothetical protein [Corynebacterium sp.]|uniref:hypothetical protein n=1 Tax=Corynebacterium sp. TaxID=1720 RepID=UPI0026DA8C9D|nr:hypothetical protein [Corynebacterium sp.]MDO5031881.1 hypothetical protein [Corynebacterium sp.]